MNRNKAWEDVRSKVACVMMVKNEEKRIEVSFDSVAGLCDTFVIYDTGSIDSTVSICHEYCKRNNIRLFLKEGTFVDFEESRNVMLDFADEVLRKPDGSPDKRYLLLLDCNDELRNHEELVKFIKNRKPTDTQTGFHLKQQWWTGNSYDSYFNIRMCMSHEDWRYHQVVHEYICKTYKKTKPKNADEKDIQRLENVILFQDRTKDDDKSMRRFKRDKQLLFKAYLRDRNDPRVVFYLAQTCGCLQQMVEAYQLYKIRTKQEGFIEEIFHGFNRGAEHSIIMRHSPYESLMLFLSGFAHSKRCESLIRLADFYNPRSKHLAYLFTSHAAKLLYPHNQILFVDRRAYTFVRWSALAKLAIDVGCLFEGKEAIIQAIQAEDSDPNNRQILRMYAMLSGQTRSIPTLESSSYSSLESTHPNQATVQYSWESTYIAKDKIIERGIQLMNQPKSIKSVESNSVYGLEYWVGWNNDQDMKEIQTHVNNQMPWQYIQGRYLDHFIKFEDCGSLLKIADHYLRYNYKGETKADFNLVYLFASHACKLKPVIVNDVDPQTEYLYGYKRWHILASCCMFMNQFEEGKQAAIKCLQYRQFREDWELLFQFLRRENEIKMNVQSGAQAPLNPETLLPFTTSFAKLIPQVEKEAVQQSQILSRKQVIQLVQN